MVEGDGVVLNERGDWEWIGNDWPGLECDGGGEDVSETVEQNESAGGDELRNGCEGMSRTAVKRMLRLRARSDARSATRARRKEQARSKQTEKVDKWHAAVSTHGLEKAKEIWTEKLGDTGDSRARFVERQDNKMYRYLCRADMLAPVMCRKGDGLRVVIDLALQTLQCDAEFKIKSLVTQVGVVYGRNCDHQHPSLVEKMDRERPSLEGTAEEGGSVKSEMAEANALAAWLNKVRDEEKEALARTRCGDIDAAEMVRSILLAKARACQLRSSITKQGMATSADAQLSDPFSSSLSMTGTEGQRVQHPMRLALTSFSGQAARAMQKLCGFPFWCLQTREEDLSAMVTSESCGWCDGKSGSSEDCRSSPIIVLSPDATEVLDTVSPNCIYVIQGLCDHARIKHASLERGQSMQTGQRRVCVRRLPLQEHANMAGQSSILTIDQVANILQEVYCNGGDWGAALRVCLPARKQQGGRK